MAPTTLDDGRKSKDQDTTISMFAHISGLFFGFFPIALIYLASEDEFTKENAANALNWHIPMSLAAILVALVGVGVSEVAGLAMALSIVIATVCFALIASLRAYQGQAWKYPIIPKLI